MLPDCHEPHTARGYCHRHYRAFLRAGAEKIEIERRYGLTDEERFWSYVEKKQGCWEWTGYKNEKGYGVINLRGERALAHRFAWQLDELIPGMSILHHCDNPACVRRKHSLEPAPTTTRIWTPKAAVERQTCTARRTIEHN